MKKKSITDAFVKVIKKSTMKKFSVSLTDIFNEKKYHYILIIKSTTEKCVRITIYPLEDKQIVKLKLRDIPDIFFNNLSDILKKYDVIHSSGLLEIDGQLFYECYLKIDIESPKIIELKKILDKVKNSSTLFSIEKIKFLK